MKTKIINTSGAARYLGYVGRHGRKFAINENITVDGDLKSTLVTHKHTGTAKLASLNADELAGRVYLHTTSSDEGTSSASP